MGTIFSILRQFATFSFLRLCDTVTFGYIRRSQGVMYAHEIKAASVSRDFSLPLAWNSVSRIENQPLGEDQKVGQMGSMLRLKMLMKSDTSEEKALISPDPKSPAYFIMKSPAAMFSSNFICFMFSLPRNEVHFYNYVVPACKTFPIRVPKVYHARATSTAFVIVMEDLEHSAAVGSCHFASNVPDPNKSDYGIDKGRIVVRQIAKLHAEFWSSNRFDRDLKWIDSFGSKARMDVFPSIYKKNLPMFFDRFSDILGEELKDVMTALIPCLDLLYKEMDKGSLTLVHGDLNAGNVCFLTPPNAAPDTEPEMCAFDWQVVSKARGIFDVAYFMGCNFCHRDYLACHEEFLRMYCRTLEENGVPSDECQYDLILDEFTLALFFPLNLMVFAIGELDQSASNETVAIGLPKITGQVVAAIKHHDAISVIKQRLFSPHNIPF